MEVLEFSESHLELIKIRVLTHPCWCKPQETHLKTHKSMRKTSPKEVLNSDCRIEPQPRWLLEPENRRYIKPTTKYYLNQESIKWSTWTLDILNQELEVLKTPQGWSILDKFRFERHKGKTLDKFGKFNEELKRRITSRVFNTKLIIFFHSQRTRL